MVHWQEKRAVYPHALAELKVEYKTQTNEVNGAGKKATTRGGRRSTVSCLLPVSSKCGPDEAEKLTGFWACFT